MSKLNGLIKGYALPSLINCPGTIHRFDRDAEARKMGLIRNPYEHAYTGYRPEKNSQKREEEKTHD